MFEKNIKISRGLRKLLNGKTNEHFLPKADLFVSNPKLRSDYLDSFSFALVVDMTQGDFVVR